MIGTHAPQPRLTLPLSHAPIQSAAPLSLEHARGAKRLFAHDAHVSAHHGLQHLTTDLAGLCGLPAAGAPGPDVVALERHVAGPLELAHQLAQKGRVPLVRVGGDQVVRLLEGEQVQHQLADRRVVPDRLVQDVRVARRGHAVGSLGQLGHAVDDGVAHAFNLQPVGQAVDVQQREVGRLAVLEEVVTHLQLLLVEPEDHVLKVLGFHVGQRYDARVALGELAVQGGREVGRLGAEKVPVDEEAGGSRSDFDLGCLGKVLELCSVTER
jgi:hypothetical protein